MLRWNSENTMYDHLGAIACVLWPLRAVQLHVSPKQVRRIGSPIRCRSARAIAEDALVGDDRELIQDLCDIRAHATCTGLPAGSTLSQGSNHFASSKDRLSMS